MNTARRSALLRASALSVAVAALAAVGGQADTPVWFTNPAFFPSGATVLTSLEMQAYAVKAAGKSSFGAVYCAEVAACKQTVPALQGYAKAFKLNMATSAAIAV